MTQPIFAQYSTVTFKTKTPLQLWIDGKPINEEGYNKYFKLRLHQDRSYEITFYHSDGRGIVAKKTLVIGEKEKKSDYAIRHNKRKDTHSLVMVSYKEQVSFADGLRKIGKVEYSVEKSGAFADSNGNVSVEHSKKEGTVDVGAVGNGVDAVTSLLGGDKENKNKKQRAEDDQPVKVLKVR